MKRIIPAVALVLAVVSCGNKTNGNNGADSLAVDSTAIVQNADSLAAQLNQAVESGDASAIKGLTEQAQSKIQELIANGDKDKAKELIATLQNFVKENAEKIAALSNGEDAKVAIESALNSLPANIKQEVTDKANEAIENAKEKAAEELDKEIDNAKEQVEEKAKETVEKAKDKAEEEVDNAKAKAEEEVNNAKSKAESAVKDEAKKALNKLGI